MLIYNYSSETKEFIDTSEAFLDPLETKAKGKNVYLCPANATFIKPMTPAVGNKAVWNGNAWEEKEDHRGIEYWLTSDVYGTPARVMTEFGPLPDNSTLVAPVKVETVEEIIEKFKATVQKHLDETARQRDYDDMNSLCSYKGSTDPVFNKEGTAGVAWRDQVWRTCYTIRDAILAEERELPTDIISELPVFTWGE